MRLTFASTSLTRNVAVAVFVTENSTLCASAEILDRQSGGAIKKVLSKSKFKGKKGQTLNFLSLQGVKARQVILVGLGKAEDINELVAQNAGGNVVRQLSNCTEATACVLVDAIKGSKFSAAELAANIAFGGLLRSYRFDKYRTKEKAEDKPFLKTLTIMTREPNKARKIFGPLNEIGKGVFFTRDLVSEPANVIYPISFASRARALTKLGVKIQVLNQDQMAKLGMGALLGVAQGSANAPRIVAMRWNGAPRAKDKRPIAFVGKGVTFDTGGISIKPSGGMEDMKWDMAGAGVVAGLMHALAARRSMVNAVGVVGMVENMPSATAQRPGDVVKTMSGQTIEVINTDAEGRLVLADAMWWCQQTFKPHTMIDLATLTGAIIVSLGHHHAGLFANDDTLAERLKKAGKATGEAVWRMPLAAAYDRQVRSNIADMKNVGGRDAGSITAAQILQRFVRDDVAWAHLDIAGVAWSNSEAATVPKGGTGFGVRLLDRLVADYYETT